MPAKGGQNGVFSCYRCDNGDSNWGYDPTLSAL